MAMAGRGWIEREAGYWVLTMTGVEANVMRDIMPLDHRRIAQHSLSIASLYVLGLRPA